jgi:hypothetical protein
MDYPTNRPTATKARIWNSLELSKLIVGVFTPLSLLFISNQLSSSDQRRSDMAQQSEKTRAEQSARFERVAEQRTWLWQDLGPNLNDIYAYLMYVGRWKQMKAHDIVTAKRDADRVFYANRPFFSEKFVREYEAFMNASFQMFNSMGEDAKPRTTSTYRQKEDTSVISGDENSDAVHASYYRLMETVAEEFGLTVVPPERPRTPGEKNVAS